MRTALLHCGLHKTGTTALQNALRDHPAALLQAAFHCPRAGRIDALGGGHHNLAWQLAGDRRFDAAAGDLAALGQELAAHPGNPILSSEDFETALADPVLLAPLLEVLRRSCGELVLLVYLRDQLSYLEAMYLELLNQRIAIDFSDFVEAALRDGAVRLPGFSFVFDYRRMLDGLAAANPGRLTVRNYHTLIGGSTVSDICAATGLNGEQFGAATTTRANTRAPIAESLRRFHANYLQRDLDAHERRAIAGLAAQIGTRRVATARTTRLRIVERFRAGNLAVCSRYGLARAGLGLRDASLLEPDVPLERLFSAATRELVGAIADALRAERSEAAGRLAATLFADNALHAAMPPANPAETA
jgi:hypothetical protein